MTAYFNDNKVETDHGRRSLRGGAVTIASRALNAIIQIGSVLFLARLLSPEDYGLVSMVAAIISFVPSLVDLGTRDAIVQRPSITGAEVSALFWLTLAVGCGTALLVTLCAPLIARFYGEPRLTAITIVSALTLVGAALQCQHYALMRRNMKFQELGLIEVGANLVSAVGAIAIAYLGFHYWALVLRPVAQNWLVTFGLWWQCRWFPRKPVMTTGVKSMLRFGLNTTGFTMTDFAGRSSDRVAIGYRGGPSVLGYYQNAMFVYDNLIDVLVGPLHQVAVASLSKVRADSKELKRLWAKALSTLVFYSMPAFGLLAVTSRDLVVVLLGAKWASAGVLLSIVALRGIPHGVERTLGWLHATSGSADRWARWGLFAMVVQLIALFSGLPFGAKGVALAYVICMFILFIPAIAYAGRPLNIGAKDVISAVWRPLVGSLIAAAIGFLLEYTLLSGFSRSARIATLFVAYVTVYAATVVGVLRTRTPIVLVLHLVRDSLPARFTWLAKTPRFVEER